jgi:hypothetical protein
VSLPELNLLLNGIQDSFILYFQINNPIIIRFLNNLRLVIQLKHINSILLNTFDILNGNFPLDFGYGFDNVEHSICFETSYIGWSSLIKDIPSYKQPITIWLIDFNAKTALNLTDGECDLILVTLAVLHGGKLFRVQIRISEHF